MIIPRMSLVILGALLLLAFVQIEARSSLKRVTRDTSGSNESGGKSKENKGKNNDLDLRKIKQFLDRIPGVAPIADVVFNYGAEIFVNLDQLTNGIISRILGGSLPCLLTKKKLTCSGTSEHGGTFAVVKRMINMLPDTILPDTVKHIILEGIRLIVIPIANTLFGGRPA